MGVPQKKSALQTRFYNIQMGGGQERRNQAGGKKKEKLKILTKGEEVRDPNTR